MSPNFSKFQQGHLRINRPGNKLLKDKNGAFVGAGADMSRSLDDVEICQKISVRTHEKAGPGPYRGPIGVQSDYLHDRGLGFSNDVRDRRRLSFKSEANREEGQQSNRAVSPHRTATCWKDAASRTSTEWEITGAWRISLP
jgi:hypothetical protein